MRHPDLTAYLGRAQVSRYAELARDERNLDRGAARGIRFQGPAGQPYSQSVNVDLLEAATQSKDKTGRLMFSTKLVQFFYTLIQFFWANGSVDKNKGGDTTTRTEIETAGSGKDLGFWLWPLGAGRCKCSTLR